MMKKIKYILALILVVWQAGHLLAQDQEKSSPLFDTDDILELTISMNVDEVIKDIEVREYHDATLSFQAEDGSTEKFNIGVKVRGKTRTNTKVCKFPPLRLNFKKKETKNTLLDGQNKLKLVTHCNSRPINEEYILREYYVYKLDQLTTSYSFKVRLCKIVYDDTAGDFDPTPHYGFLIEDIDHLAKRHGMVEYDGKILNQEVCDKPELDKLMFFEYLIGNLDFSVPDRHNFKIIANPGKSLPVAIPYDFDYSGIVNTSYAEVPPGIDVVNVRTRVFRGLCRPVGGYDPTIKFYQEIKPQIYALYEESPYLSEKSKKTTLKFIDDFYKVLDNPKSLEQNITKACRAKHKHIYEY
jgi:hypothetical protein